MDNDKKRGGDPAAGEADNTIRARNRTIMLTPEMTGHVRARLVSPSSSVTTPLVAGGEESEDSEMSQGGFRSGGWQPSPPPSSSGSDNGGSSGEDDNDWTRPIAGAVAEGDSEPQEEEAAPEAPEDQWVKSSPSAGRAHREAPAEAPPARQAPQMKNRAAAPSRPAPAASQDGDFVIWRASSPLCGFLVTFDHNELGDYIELRSGRLIVTSEEEGNGNVLCIRDGNVSPMHAIMRVTAGAELQVLDQLSDSGTKVFRLGSDEEEFLSGEKTSLRHGDVVVFGERKYHVCLLVGR